MALNYSHMPVFPPHISDDNLWSPMRIVNGCLAEGIPEKNVEGYGRPWHVNRGEFEEWNINRGKDRADCCRSPESNSKDIVDLLPSDPFGMDIETTFTAITGWLEDLEVDYSGYLSSSNWRSGQENYNLFADWSVIWNNALKFQPFCGNHQHNQIGLQYLSNPQVDKKSRLATHSCPSSSQLGVERDMGDPLAPYDFGFQTVCDEGGIAGINEESTCCSSELQLGEKMEGFAKDGALHEAWNFALSYLGVKELLSVERACKSFRVSVKEAYWLWMSIHIDQPLNERITDDLLLQLASRANGNLQCLSLVECPKVTDDGIRRVLETNPRLTKLFVPGCTRLTIEGILINIKNYNSNKDFQGIKHLRIGGLYGVTRDHYEELKLLLGPGGLRPDKRQEPHFYHRGNFYLPFDDNRTIDIEMCPRCEKFRLVYDCPAGGCQVKESSSQACRACTLCIARCAQCGRCISDNEYEETFCLDLLCSYCFKQMLKCQNEVDKKVDDTCVSLDEQSFLFPKQSILGSSMIFLFVRDEYGLSVSSGGVCCAGDLSVVLLSYYLGTTGEWKYIRVWKALDEMFGANDN
ncbi:F-box protein SKIP14 [Striga hermonthica]|uniref:F-box protein SKIP14 n=1 Tax=Striga hermonthica TaxID=68872 RepID=A0A9N7NNC5_STRHE|nr:F-box protein SKIP14 [Striga hermonthica]